MDFLFFLQIYLISDVYYITMLLYMKLPVTIFKEGGQFVAYTPALDISTAGKDAADAEKKFIELVSIFLEETVTAGTTAEVLTDLGWQKQQETWIPPTIASPLFIDINLPVFA